MAHRLKDRVPGIHPRRPRCRQCALFYHAGLGWSVGAGSPGEATAGRCVEGATGRRAHRSSACPPARKPGLQLRRGTLGTDRVVTATQAQAPGCGNSGPGPPQEAVIAAHTGPPLVAAAGGQARVTALAVSWPAGRERLGGEGEAAPGISPPRTLRFRRVWLRAARAGASRVATGGNANSREPPVSGKSLGNRLGSVPPSACPRAS